MSACIWMFNQDQPHLRNQPNTAPRIRQTMEDSCLHMFRYGLSTMSRTQRNNTQACGAAHSH